MKKTLILVLLSVLFLVAFTGCISSDDDEKNGDNGSEASITINGQDYTWKDMSKDFNMKTVDGNSGVSLSDIVNASGISNPGSHGYLITASDGYSKNVTWWFMLKGILMEEEMTTYFPDLPKRYKIKETVAIEVNDEIKTITINGVELTQEMPFDNWFPVTNLNGTEGVLLAELINYTGVSNPSAHQYKIIAEDDYNKTVSWDDMLNGVYVQSDYKSFFLNLPKGYHIKNIKEIKVI